MRISPKDLIFTYKKLGNVTQTAKKLGVSRMTVYRWVKRARTGYGTLSTRGLKRYSTRPSTIHTKLLSEQKVKIIALKQGTHLGARKIQFLLQTTISSSTIHRFLKTRSLITKQKSYRRPLFQNGKAMRPRNTTSLGYLQMDTKHVTPELSGLLSTVFEYAAIDILSRYKLAVILPDISSESASLALEFFLKWFPFKVAYIQTDNGLEYQDKFELTCQKHGINHYFIYKNSPNENAVIERSFRTDQDEFYYWLENAPEHIGQLNEWLQTFINQYNTWRPHQALSYKTPLEVVKMYQMS